MGLSKVILEGDSEIVINALNENLQSFVSFGLLIQDVKNIANYFHCISFPHVHRDGNCVAYHLTKHARHVTGFSVWIEDVPSYTFGTYQADLPTL